MFRALILTSSLALCACTTVEPLRPDMQARPLPSRVDEIAFINGLRAAYDTSNLATNCYTGVGLQPFRPKFVQGYRQFDEKAEQLSQSQCVRFRTLPSNSAQRDPLVREYLANGFGLTDLYCQRFFMVAAESRQSRRMQASTLSGVDTLVTSVFTALGAGTVTTGILNNAFESADSAYNNIDAAFVVAPDRDDLIKLVQAAQDSLRTQTFERLPRSYPEARSAIERYSSMCSFDGMRSLVGVAMKRAASDLNKDAAGGEGDETHGTNKPGPKTGTEPAPSTRDLANAPLSK